MSCVFCDVGELLVETIGYFRFRYSYFVISKLDGLVGVCFLFARLFILQSMSVFRLWSQ